jgi:hypothetical protein
MRMLASAKQDHGMIADWREAKPKNCANSVPGFRSWRVN